MYPVPFPSPRRFAGTAALVLATAAPLAAQSLFPPDDSIRTAVRRAVDIRGGVGVVVGLLDANGTRRIVVVGDTSWDGRTLFEIGSITKTFTGLLLADAVERGEVRLDQPVAELLPDSLTVPTRNGRRITLLNLATHTAGLPRISDNFRPADWRNPYADYTVTQLYDFLRRHELRRDIGVAPLYSNYGAALLGHALARRAGMTYEGLVRARILTPLGMTNTMIAIPDSLRPRVAPGHNPAGERVTHWELSEAVAGAGALRSGADDMLTYLAAMLAPADTTTLGRAIRRATARHPVGDWRGGLFWGINTNPFGRTSSAHGGGTGGYATWAGFDSERRVGVVVLSNSIGAEAPRIGAHLLDPRVPVTTRPLRRGIAALAYALMVLLVIGTAAAWQRAGAPPRRVAKVAFNTAVGAAVWLAVTSVAAQLGLLRFDTAPPTMMLAFVVTIAVAVWLGVSRVGARLAALPLAALVGVHAFRLPLELLLHDALEAGLLPPQMSYTGWNFDIVTGISAIVVALVVATGRAGVRTVRAWNWLGTILLLNIVVISILSAPGPLRAFRTAPANTWITIAPYVWVPTVMVAFAILGHLVLFRRLRAPLAQLPTTVNAEPA